VGKIPRFSQKPLADPLSLKTVAAQAEDLLTSLSLSLPGQQNQQGSPRYSTAKTARVLRSPAPSPPRAYLRFQAAPSSSSSLSSSSFESSPSAPSSSLDPLSRFCVFLFSLIYWSNRSINRSAYRLIDFRSSRGGSSMDAPVFPGIRCGSVHASMIRERGGGLGRPLSGGVAWRGRGPGSAVRRPSSVVDSGRREMDCEHHDGEAFKQRQHGGLRAAWNGLRPRHDGEAFELWPSWIQMRRLPAERERERDVVRGARCGIWSTRRCWG
jgi:hypothetical protein